MTSRAQHTRGQEKSCRPSFTLPFVLRPEFTQGGARGRAAVQDTVGRRKGDVVEAIRTPR
jgi:hypothetical protein